MDYSVQQLAGLSGVTPRTLRWYDKIRLLCPARGPNGYRRYGPAEVARLQQILFYRNAGLELADIAAVLDAGAFDAADAMEGHLAGLRQKRDELDALIATAEKTLQNLKGECDMNDAEKFEGFKKKLVDDNEAKYGEEVRQRWGDGTADKSNAQMMNMTQEQYQAFEALGAELNATLATAVATGDPAGEAAQKAADLHRQWLGFTWPAGQYSGEAHKGLAQMYVDDERFTAHYEAIAPGAAAFLRDAIVLYADGQD